MKNYTSFERNEWAKLAPKNKVNITKEELTQIKSLGDVVDLTDVHEIYTSRAKLRLDFCINLLNQHRLSSVFQVR